MCFRADREIVVGLHFLSFAKFYSLKLFQQHLSEINDPLVEQAILDNIEDVYYKDDSFDSSLHELQVKLTK